MNACRWVALPEVRRTFLIRGGKNAQRPSERATHHLKSVAPFVHPEGLYSGKPYAQTCKLLIMVSKAWLNEKRLYNVEWEPLRIYSSEMHTKRVAGGRRPAY